MPRKAALALPSPAGGRPDSDRRLKKGEAVHWTASFSLRRLGLVALCLSTSCLEAPGRGERSRSLPWELEPRRSSSNRTFAERSPFDPDRHRKRKNPATAGLFLQGALVLSPSRPRRPGSAFRAGEDALARIHAGSCPDRAHRFARSGSVFPSTPIGIRKEKTRLQPGFFF
jgi:hypothetical protein